MGSTKIAKPFYFKQFALQQDRCAMKIGTDGILLGAWADTRGVHRILDIGTGSGLIAIMLAQRTKEALIDAVEIDADACSQAQKNMKSSPWSERLRAFPMAIQDFRLSADTKDGYDLVISNPPFFSGGTFSFNQDRTSVRHTIKLPHNDLLGAVRKLLHSQGRFCTILPLIEGLRFQELAESYHLYCTKITEVRPKADKPIERLLMQFEKEQRTIARGELVLRGEDGQTMTPAYTSLTEAFYYKL